MRLAYRVDVIAILSTVVVAAALTGPLGSTSASPAVANPDVASLEALRAIDLRLAIIAQRLVTANATLCRDTVPATGMILHAETQYDPASQPAARQAFRFATPVSVEAVVPGSPAAVAGIRANDGLAKIGSDALGAAAQPPSSADRDAALDVLERQKSPLFVTVARDGERREVKIPASLGCRARFEVVLGPKMTAQSDGKVVQIGMRFFERYRDEETAVIVAHELAHVILKHRVRLEAAGVKGGLLKEIGRNAQLGQTAELEADTLGVALLHNAGFDPASAARFWRERGGDIDGGLFRSRTHPATKRRIAAIEAAAGAIPAGERPYLSPVLAQRDSPLR
ncbi:M48 family metalloprotease [Sphingomonas sp. IC-11]|uniref:M48 family metalloprotease n=1 Tax=Sphingomonas sp. IC-11 TaxID=2898528 RepID=UPI001E4D852F|nr:M48 family metalloprotease [Sphingomonas sp. IC-11]MCD2314934.1 M48 family metalloprotease [Sphingomonas sp. IC-11]